MSLVTITQQDHTDTLAAAAVQREREVFGYQININNYAAMLAALPKGDWPEHLAQYKTTQVEMLPADMPDADVLSISEYQYRGRILGLLRTERVEQAKTRRVLEAIRSQLPPGQDQKLMLAAAAQAPRGL